MVGISRSRYEIYPITLSETLPKFNIPLLLPDADVPLHFQLVFNRCYGDGAYDDLIDYSHPPDVLLTLAEHLFVTGRLAKTQAIAPQICFIPELTVA